MKKLIPFLLVILSMSLFAQEPTYWEKIDFEFDSGIKFISLRNYYKNYESKYPFVITTDSSSVYYFENYDKVGIKVINAPSTNIKESHLLLKNDTNYIFILTEDKRLFVTDNYGTSWEQIDDDVDNSSINSIAIIKDMIVTGADDKGAYVSKNYPNSWRQIKNGLENRKILELFESYWNIYCLSDDKKVMFYDHNSVLDSVEWVEEKDLSEYQVIKNIQAGSGFVFFNENENIQLINQFEEKQEITFGDSIDVTCFAVHTIGVLSFVNNKIPHESNLFIGTKNHGLYYCYTDYVFVKQFSSELFNEEITYIKFDRNYPEICLTGTANGNLYYALIDGPESVTDKSQNILNTRISPHPARIKANLNFTLPQNAKISIILYSTLGIEIKTITDGYFNEGENVVPIDVSDIPNGVYLIAIRYDGRIIVEKLVVRK